MTDEDEQGSRGAEGQGSRGEKYSFATNN